MQRVLGQKQSNIQNRQPWGWKVDYKVGLALLDWEKGSRHWKPWGNEDSKWMNIVYDEVKCDGCKEGDTADQKWMWSVDIKGVRVLVFNEVQLIKGNKTLWAKCSNY